MKVIVAISIAVVAFLFVKRYDLYEATDGLASSYEVVEEDFFLKGSCVSKGELLERPFRCVGHNVWGGFVKKNHDYNKEREVD
ncbi:hypothetical protein [Pseudomaricurvus sp. HS19]|uniref:hypothetical protein n=1 Tax=Pseudomaricurvus sp. HS19 TaxID=2692626 RepID=UPI00136B7D5D|nr:hypothetical protein [Pseudomaricurvus sp. HS19]MYM64202.1 hypothetical protein [Pseudomaricurvus sp. HS19]